MLYRLTVVRSSKSPRFAPGTVPQVIDLARRTGFRAHEWTWLAPGHAGSVVLEGDSPALLTAALRRLDRLRADIFLTSAVSGRKKLLIADMESTTIENEFLEELAAFVGVQDEVKAITARAMNGEVDFAGALAERVALLKGLPTECLNDALKTVRVSAGAAVLVATMKRWGARTALVSGGFTCFAEPVGTSLGFDYRLANQLETAEGRLTGFLRGPVVDAPAKARFLRQLCQELDISAQDVVAVGDGANDIEMIQAAGLGIGYRPKPAVAAVCELRIEHGDLTSVLFVQGCPESQFWRGEVRLQSG